LDYLFFANVIYVLLQWNLNVASKIWLKFGVFLCLFYLIIISLHIFKKVLQKNRDAIYIGYSFLFLIPSVGIDIISNFGFFKLPQVLSPISFLFFIVSLSIILTLNIEKMRRNIEDLNVNLEENVTRRTLELHTSLENIKKLKAKEDNLHYIIGTSLKDSVSEIKELSYHLLHQEFISSKEIESIMNEIHKDSEEVFESFDDIITWTKLQTGLISPKKEKVELKEFFSKLIPSIPSPSISITSYIDETNIKVDSTLLGFVLKKFLSQVSTSAVTSGNLIVTSRTNGSGIEIEISMDGTGISKEKWQENWKVNHETLGTSQNREKVNLSAIILPQYMEFLHAGYKVEEEGRLLKVTIQIPNCLVG
jgi:K+-sensing histidine kinase KdpD